jgi:hypothetical protein
METKMTNRNFEVHYKNPNGRYPGQINKVIIGARNHIDAKDLIKNQYGLDSRDVMTPTLVLATTFVVGLPVIFGIPFLIFLYMIS